MGDNAYEEHMEDVSSDTSSSPFQTTSRPSVDANYLGCLFGDLTMSTPGPGQTTFDSGGGHGGIFGDHDRDGSVSPRTITLPSMYDAEAMHQYSSGYQDDSRLPSIRDIMPSFQTDAHEEPTTAPEPKLGDPVQLSRVRRSIDPLRLQTRGHRDGFTSFGERASVDMPNASIAHFSVTKRRRSLDDDAANDDDESSTAARHKPRTAPPESVLVKMMKHPELAISLARHLPVQDLLSLYAISRDFHGIVNHRFTTVMMAQALARAPEAARIFPFRCYASLCQADPAARPHPLPRRAGRGEARTVPTFRWLKMVCFREMVVHEIMVLLAEDGVPVPGECRAAIKKVWLMMDIPDNLRRIGLVQNEKIFTDRDLFFATMFFIKLDMRFTDPLTGSGADGMKRMLLSQPSLSYLWRALRRTILTSKLDVIRMFVRWKYVADDAERDQPLFGIPPEEIGVVQYEAWGKSSSRTPLQRPDELVMKEAIRRGLKMHKKYTDMFLWGYVNPNTFENIEPQVLERRLGRLEGLEKELVPLEDRKVVVPRKEVSYRVIQREAEFS